MKILYMGTPDFAARPLKALIEAGHEVCGVVSQPDRPRGRGEKVEPPPCKAVAVERGIEVFQPESLKGGAFLAVLEKLKPELIVVAAYGKILPKYILDFPRLGCINIHASILPKYRGAAPIQWAVINGERETGVSIMYMNEKMDEGDVILVHKTPISESETSGELFLRLSEMSVGALFEALLMISENRAPRTPQDGTKATYAPMIGKELGHIDWTKGVRDIFNLIRGVTPAPGAFSLSDGGRVKIIRAVLGSAKNGAPGEVLEISKDGMFVMCGDGISLCVTELQFENSKKMPAFEYFKGHESIRLLW